MRIAFIVPRLVNQGPILVVRDIISGLKEKDISCTVFYFDDVQEISMGCEVRRISFWEKFDFASYDVIHSHMLRPDLYVYWHYSAIKKCKCKCVSTLHNYMHDDLRYRYNKFISFIFSRIWLSLLKHHDKIITLSCHAMQYYKQWLPLEKLSYVYNAKSVDRTKDLTKEEKQILFDFKGKNVLIGVNALLTPRKGVDQLIKVLPELSGFVLVVVGDGQSRDYLEKLSIEYKVRERCLFLGYKLDAYRYLPYYDIYGMVSRSEGFPLSLIEAAAYGVPTICSRIPVFEEVFTPKDVAFFTLDDLDELKKTLIDLAEHKEIGKTFNDTYNKYYTIEQMAENYLQIYKNGISQ